MNNIKQFLSGALFLAGTLITLSSCNDEGSTRQAGGNLAVVFTTTVGQSIDNGAEPARAGSAPGTRLAGNTWEQDDRIGITMLDIEEELTAIGVFKQYVAQSGTSATLSPAATDQTLYYPEDGTYVSFVAFYPYATVTDRKVTYNKFDDQSTAALMAACDFVYSNEGEAFNVESQTATLNFDHKLSKLVVNVKTATGDDAIDLSKVSVTIEGMPAKVEANLEDGTITVSEVATIIPYAPADAISATAYNAQAIVAPHSAEDYGNRKVTFTYNDGTEEKTTSSTISNDLEFKSGKVYQLNFTLTAKPDAIAVEPTGAAITDWTGGTWTYNYTINTPKNITIPAAADEHEYTFRTNYTGSVSLIYSTSATDAHAGVPSWLTKVQDPTASKPDTNGMITYTYKFSVADNVNEDEQIAYLHLNVETKNVVIKVTQEGKPIEFVWLLSEGKGTVKTGGAWFSFNDNDETANGGPGNSTSNFPAPATEDEVGTWFTNNNGAVTLTIYPTTYSTPYTGIGFYWLPGKEIYSLADRPDAGLCIEYSLIGGMNTAVVLELGLSPADADGGNHFAVYLPAQATAATRYFRLSNFEQKTGSGTILTLADALTMVNSIRFKAYLPNPPMMASTSTLKIKSIKWGTNGCN